MRLVVDASVAIKWVVEEEGRPEARQLLLDGHELLAPEFLLIESANVLRSKVARGLLHDVQAIPALQAIESALGRFVLDRGLADRALHMALRLGHPVYDCLYLACAEHSDAEFVTADTKLIGKLKDLDGFPRIRALSS